MNRKGFSKILIIIAIASIFLGAWTYYKLEIKSQFKQISPKMSELAFNSPESQVLQEYLQKNILNIRFPGGPAIRTNYMIQSNSPTIRASQTIFSSVCTDDMSEAFNWVQQDVTDAVKNWNSRSSTVDYRLNDKINFKKENEKYFEFAPNPEFVQRYGLGPIRVHKCNYIIFNNFNLSHQLPPKNIIAVFQADLNLESAQELFEYLRSELVPVIYPILAEKFEEFNDRYQLKIVTLHHSRGSCSQGEIFIDTNILIINKITKEIEVSGETQRFSDLLPIDCRVPGG